MQDKELYERIIRTLLIRWKSILGGQTVYNHTLNIPGLIITPIGDLLKLDGDGFASLDELLKRFEAISGIVSIGISYEALKAILDLNPHLKVPDKLSTSHASTESFLNSIR